MAPNYNGNQNPEYYFFYENPASDPVVNGQLVGSVLVSWPSITGSQVVGTEIYIGDMSGSPDPGGQLLWLFFENDSTTQTTGWFAGKYPTNPSNYNGSSIAYIVERPGLNGNTLALAEFSGLASMPFHDGMYYQSGNWSDGATYADESFNFFAMWGNSLSYTIAVNSYQTCPGGDTCSPAGSTSWWGAWQGCNWQGFQ